jgi:hypothetical protein
MASMFLFKNAETHRKERLLLFANNPINWHKTRTIVPMNAIIKLLIIYLLYTTNEGLALEPALH